jgi:hypothetical protein
MLKDILTEIMPKKYKNAIKNLAVIVNKLPKKNSILMLVF